MVVEMLTQIDGPNLFNKSSPRAIDPDLFKFEEKRLQTFENWPLYYPVDKERLAKAGFYYLGSEDKVECFSCKGQITNWEEGDSPFMRHKTIYPNCTFVKGNSDNVPMINLCRYPNNYCSARINSTNSTTTYSPSLVNGTSNKRAPLRPIFMSGNPSTSRERFNGQSTSSSTNPTSINTNSESERLKSFKGWPLKTPSPEKLAEAGFYYLHESDKVQCAFCQGIICNWELTDDPILEHKKHFSYCPFIQNKDVNNIPRNTKKWFQGGQDVAGFNYFEKNAYPERRGVMPQNGRSLGQHELTGPAHISHALPEARTRSYLSWPSNSPINVDLLVEAGFFYTGKNDFTQCYYCDGGLCNWEVTDDPWIEHARWFPFCAHVVFNKGKPFIDACIKNKPPNPRNTVIVEPSRIEMEKYKKKADEQMSEPFIRRMIETELFTYEQVRVAVERQLQETGETFDNEDDLCEAIVYLQLEEETQRRQQANGVRRAHPTSNGVIRHSMSSVSNGDTNHSMTGASNGDVSHHILNVSNGDVSPQMPEALTNGSPIQEVLSLPSTSNEVASPPTKDTNNFVSKRSDTLLCKVCMDKEVGMVFLPCGHLLACTSCGLSLKECPVCRIPIQGAVRTFLS